MVDLTDKQIGVWGYGIGGRALVDFLLSKSIEPILFDKRQLSGFDRQMLIDNHVEIVDVLEDFLEQADMIVPSAGVDLRKYSFYKNKYVAELDFFQHFFNKPIIAVTGTLGKTTVATCLAKILERAGDRVALGGNIGVGLCSLLNRQNDIDYAVVEVSSFQLELCKEFAPTVAVWTNFFPNHLDRHSSIEDYFQAKINIIKFQRKGDLSVVPSNLFQRIKSFALHDHAWNLVQPDIPDKWRSLIESQVGIASNWLIICSTLKAMGIPLDLLNKPLACSLEHRIEYVATVNGRMFYNDSKSTVPEATLAAVERLYPAQIILLLGGLSKGVCRLSLIKKLKNRVKKVICFGAESQELASFCNQNQLVYAVGDALEEAVKIAYTEGLFGDLILLSPSGSSFDLFQNYQERGIRFKQIVSKLKGIR